MGPPSASARKCLHDERLVVGDGATLMGFVEGLLQVPGLDEVAGQGESAFAAQVGRVDAG
jgi:hypothetical protein